MRIKHTHWISQPFHTIYSFLWLVFLPHSITCMSVARYLAAHVNVNVLLACAYVNVWVWVHACLLAIYHWKTIVYTPMALCVIVTVVVSNSVLFCFRLEESFGQPEELCANDSTLPIDRRAQTDRFIPVTSCSIRIFIIRSIRPVQCCFSRTFVAFLTRNLIWI